MTLSKRRAELDEFQAELETMICPRCAKRNIDDARTGFCYPCRIDRSAEHYAVADGASAAERRAALEQRNREAKRLFWRLRQERHRMLEQTRPRTPLDRGADPLLVAFEAVKEVRLAVRILRGYGAGSSTLERVGSVAETLKQLAWVGAEES